MTFGAITVAIDGSETAEAALQVAIDLAKHYDSELTIVAVAPFAPVFVTPNEPFVPPALPASSLPKYQEVVDAALRSARGQGLSHVQGFCTEGVVVDELLGRISAHRTDLLVVGSRGLSGAKRLLLGSVSTALVTRAPCPVLVVRPSPTPTTPEASP